MPKPVVLCILDGWGHRDETEANAPARALYARCGMTEGPGYHYRVLRAAGASG